jgi:hypothetical protein
MGMPPAARANASFMLADVFGHSPRAIAREDTTMSLLFRLMRALFGAFFRIVFTALAFAGIAGGATLIVAYQQSHQWPPKTLTDVVAGVIAVLAAYAAALTVLVREAVKGVEHVEKDVAKGAEELEHEAAGRR